MRKTSIILIIILIVSCKNNSNKHVFKEYDREVDLFKLADTLYIGVDYIGDFEYSSPLDTIKSELIDDRFVFLYLTSDSPENTKNGYFANEQEVKEVNHRSFVVDNGRVVFSFRFKDLGKSRLSWVIEDKVIFKTDLVTKKARIITNYIPYGKDLYIKDNSFISKISR